ncbi:hypothetical protein CAPTEDRAFT_197628 [Capitella teleta]|uniref:UDP-N-acetylglucosamine transporter n=1 Tax=Capitella teleta TaxID=283909 RepID=R7U8V4_CAPTE|nr:hypothetical protein CAPTEDRAFT_197628 [Capitella teleta]|eukprot:ELT99550.1 hypothetical protein CAPTEDRAFT_197628 [Capitella teleta]
MRYVRVRPGDLFLSTTAVILAEFCKFSFCLSLIFYQENFSIRSFARHLHENIIAQPMDCLKISVPSIVYTLQNNLLYVAVSNLEAATFQVTYQLKILTTALFSVIMLRKQLSRLQWVSLVILFIGVSVVQLQSQGETKSDKVAQEQRPILGLIAVIVSCMMSGFAGVYFEKILKGTTQTIWLRNVQMSVVGIFIGFVTMEINDGESVHKNGFFFGYDWLVYFVVFLQSFGGIMVAVVVKYADNILKGFATSAAIVVSCIASMYFFDFQLTLQFTVGATLVMTAVYMYSKFVPTPPTPASMKNGV